MVISLFFFGCGFSLAEETITIASYYPSPYGSYMELRSSQMSVGSAYMSTAIPSNTLIVGGQVGIALGSNPPGASYRLDINGNIAASDVWVPSKNKFVSTVECFVEP